MKHFLSALDVPDVTALADSAAAFKAAPRSAETLGRGKRIGCLFLNPSLRTRLSTQVAAQQLGMEAIVFNVGAEGWALEFAEGAVMNGTTVEHVKDAAPILGQYFDILAIRTFPGLKDRAEDYSERYISQFVKYAGVPVVSLESATLHPLQSLADLLTIRETFAGGRRPKVVLSWAPHVKPLPQCVANSFAQWMTVWGGADFVVTHPEGYTLDPQYTKGASITHNQDEAFEGADYIYVKNWSSYEQYGQILSNDTDWMLTLDKLKATNNGKVMHCLPVRRNVELSDEVLDSAHSLVTQQAGNRVWAAQAVLADILKSNA
ncbi:N-acetylornithine carbamoyltransferase [Flaviaesturariibacter aridisoli]|uniref:N-succinylornithine carbamoyltransferase n=1 Tax=Flaviaesturariibacter aridisoli TaxID=2545761 RepID=A0A4R4E4Q4_9BACT|nr:N-acetylornithine carbamoyltransferase [Flaviaesturariibacter aridisoli]TCZ72981.1 N-acetylornithine carbamoyltransferase [Flaviaesturariibacter aridisoli]